MLALEQLAATWRGEAATIRERYGDGPLAVLCETHAQELEAAGERLGLEHWSPQETAVRTGYTVGYLRCLLSNGKLTNVGRRGRPKIAAAEALAVLGRRVPKSLKVARRRGPAPAWQPLA